MSHVGCFTCTEYSKKKNVYHFLLLLLLIYSEASMEIDMEVPCDVQDEDDDFD